MEKNLSEQAPFTNEEEYQQYVDSLNIDPALLQGIARAVVIARYSEWTPDGRRYSTQEEIDATIEALKSKGEWPEEPADGRPVIGRALMNRRRYALMAEGIVMRPIWL